MEESQYSDFTQEHAAESTQTAEPTQPTQTAPIYRLYRLPSQSMFCDEVDSVLQHIKEYLQKYDCVHDPVPVPSSYVEHERNYRYVRNYTYYHPLQYVPSCHPTTTIIHTHCASTCPSSISTKAPSPICMKKEEKKKEEKKDEMWRGLLMTTFGAVITTGTLYLTTKNIVTYFDTKDLLKKIHTLNDKITHWCEYDYCLLVDLNVQELKRFLNQVMIVLVRRSTYNAVQSVGKLCIGATSLALACNVLYGSSFSYFLGGSFITSLAVSLGSSFIYEERDGKDRKQMKKLLVDVNSFLS